MSKIVQGLKRTAVNLIGRPAANRLSAPYHDWRARRRTRQFLAGLPERNLCVNLGCGHRPLAGWINVDRARGSQVQIVWDVAAGLPFRDSTCSAVFTEHVIEHLPRDNAFAFLKECFRVLEPGGVLRVSTPDAEKYLRSYCGDGEFLRHSDFQSAAETPLDRINQMMREYGQHLWTYDAQSLTLLLRKAGFDKVVRQEFGCSIHPRMAGIDAAERAFESLYLEAVKQG